MRKVTISIITLVLLTASFFLGKHIGKINKTNKQIVGTQLYDFVGELLLRNIQIQQENLNKTLTPTLKLTSLENTQITIKDLVNKSKKLVFAFSSLNCPQCIEHELEIIQRHACSIGTDNIVLAASDYNLRYLKIFKTRYNLKSEIYNIGSDKFQLPIDSLNTPYYILTDTTLRILDIFIPSKDIPNYDENYLQSMIKILSETQN